MRVALFSALTLAFCMLTPIVRGSPLVEQLPLWLQWHLRPAGDMTVFTLLPWAGSCLPARPSARCSRRRATRGLSAARTSPWASCGAALIALGFYTAGRPSIYASSSFWTSSPTWFAIRVGIMMLALSWLYGLEQAVGQREESVDRPHGALKGVLLSWQAPLERLGRHSLFIYWIHVELVYGYSAGCGGIACRCGAPRWRMRCSAR